MAGLFDFQEFAAWQRAEELRVMCEEFLSLGRFKPKEFAQFVSIAKGSETEVLNILLEARSSKFLTATEFPKFEPWNPKH